MKTLSKLLQDFCHIARPKLESLVFKKRRIKGLLNAVNEKSVVILHIICKFRGKINLIDKDGNNLLHFVAFKG